MAEITEIVQRAIGLARTVKIADQARFETARVALQKLVDELQASMPTHPAMQLLLDYLKEIDDEKMAH